MTEHLEKAEGLAIANFLRFVGFDRANPLSIRFDFGSEADRIAAADEVDLILSDAFAAARARMAAVLAEAREQRGGKPVKVRLAKPGWADNGICRQHGVYLCTDCAVEATPEAASPKPAEGTVPDDGWTQGFLPMDAWDERDEAVLLLVDYGDGDHPLTDARFAVTIGHNNDHNVGEDEGQGWRFAGWCWSHDHYVEGKGTPVGWMPIPHILARAYAAFDGEPAASPKPTIVEASGMVERHIETLRHLSGQYLPGGPRDIKGAIQAAIKALSASSPSSEQGKP